MQPSSSIGTAAIRKILVPVDGSVGAKDAARVAVHLASVYKAGLAIISVVAPPAFFISGPVGAPADLTEYYRLESEDATNAIESVAGLAKDAGVDATSKVLSPSTSVVETIVEYASTEKVDMIVIGTRGLGGFKKMLLGSVSSGVLEHAPCSVFVAR